MEKQFKIGKNKAQTCYPNTKKFGKLQLIHAFMFAANMVIFNTLAMQYTEMSTFNIRALQKKSHFLSPLCLLLTNPLYIFVLVLV